MFREIVCSKYLLEYNIELFKLFDSPFSLKTTVTNLSEYEVATFVFIVRADVPDLFINKNVSTRKFVKEIYFSFNCLG